MREKTNPNARWVEKKALVSLVLGAICIAFAPLLVRLSEVEPVTTAFYRMALALPFLLLWGLSAGHINGVKGGLSLALPRQGLMWLAGFFFAGDLALWHWSIHYTSIANATLMANLAPVFVALFAYFVLRERFKPIFLIGIVAALMGATLLIQGGIRFGTGSLLGDGLGVFTAVFYAGYILSISELRKKQSTFQVMISSTFISAIILLPIAVFSETALLPTSTDAWLVLVVLALLPQCLGQGLIAYGMAHLPAAYSSISLLVQPVAAAYLAWYWLNEAMGGIQIIGGLIVLAAITLCHVGRTGLKASENASTAN